MDSSAAELPLLYILAICIISQQPTHPVKENQRKKNYFQSFLLGRKEDMIKKKRKTEIMHAILNYGYT